MTKPWTRPDLSARAPNRAFGGLVRTADVERGGSTLAGVPLQTVSDAVVATVKLGYQVADRQIDRGTAGSTCAHHRLAGDVEDLQPLRPVHAIR